MSNSSDGDGVRYRRPPKSTRWKKGQSGNPRNGKARSQRAESPLVVIERLLQKPVDAMKDGHSTRMPALGAIMFQLVQKSLAGDKKAERTRQKFEEFALQDSVSELEIIFVDNDYTRAFAASEDGDG